MQHLLRAAPVDLITNAASPNTHTPASLIEMRLCSPPCQRLELYFLMGAHLPAIYVITLV